MLVNIFLKKIITLSIILTHISTYTEILATYQQTKYNLSELFLQPYGFFVNISSNKYKNLLTN